MTNFIKCKICNENTNFQDGITFSEDDMRTIRSMYMRLDICKICNDVYRERILDALDENDLESIKCLFKQYSWMCNVFIYGLTPLMHSICLLRENMVDYFLSLGELDINAIKQDTMYTKQRRYQSAIIQCASSYISSEKAQIIKRNIFFKLFSDVRIKIPKNELISGSMWGLDYVIIQSVLENVNFVNLKYNASLLDITGYRTYVYNRYSNISSSIRLWKLLFEHGIFPGRISGNNLTFIDYIIQYGSSDELLFICDYNCKLDNANIDRLYHRDIRVKDIQNVFNLYIMSYIIKSLGYTHIYTIITYIQNLDKEIHCCEYSYLKSRLDHVNSLMEISRKKIKESFQCGLLLIDSIKKLPLPTRLIEYIVLFPEKKFVNELIRR
jgi:hypothetical protein